MIKVCAKWLPKRENNVQINGLSEVQDPLLPKTQSFYYKLKKESSRRQRQDTFRKAYQYPHQGLHYHYSNEQTQQISRENFIQKTENILEHHHSDYQFDVTSFSHEMGISRVHLFRLMKTYHEQSPSEYIRNYRLQRAAKLLNISNISVSEIAYRTGYEDLSHFSKSFKKLFGVSPSRFKTLQQISYEPQI